MDKMKKTKELKKEIKTAEKAEKNQNTAKTVGLVMIIMLIGKVTGLLRDIVLNAKMGTESTARTALDPALSIPSQFLDFAFAAALSSSFIPVFNYYLEKKSKKEAFDLANSFITIMSIATVTIVIVATIFSPQLIGIFAINDIETKTLAIRLLNMMLPTIFLTAAAFSLTGVLQSLGEFNIPAAMSVLSNVIIILYFVFLYDTYGVEGLAVAFLVGWGTQICVQIPPLIRKGFTYRPNFNFISDGMKEIGILMLPVLVSTWVVPVNTLVNKRVASQLYNASGMNILTTASGFYSVITGVFILSVANVIFPKLSKQSAGGDLTGFSQTIKATLRVSAFMLIPMSLGLCLLGEPVIRLVYQRGEFTEISTERSSLALICYSVGMIGLGMQTILSRGFYALKDARTPFITAIIAIVANGIFSVMLVNPLGIGGPALASSISINLVGLIMLLVMWKKDKEIFDYIAAAAVVKMAVSAVLMGIGVFFVSKILPDGKYAGFFIRLIAVVAPVGVGIVIYFAFTLLLKVDEAIFVYKQVKERIFAKR